MFVVIVGEVGHVLVGGQGLPHLRSRHGHQGKIAGVQLGVVAQAPRQPLIGVAVLPAQGVQLAHDVAGKAQGVQLVLGHVLQGEGLGVLEPANGAYAIGVKHMGRTPLLAADGALLPADPGQPLEVVVAVPLLAAHLADAMVPVMPGLSLAADLAGLQALGPIVLGEAMVAVPALAAYPAGAAVKVVELLGHAAVGAHVLAAFLVPHPLVALLFAVGALVRHQIRQHDEDAEDGDQHNEQVVPGIAPVPQAAHAAGEGAQAEDGQNHRGCHAPGHGRSSGRGFPRHGGKGVYHNDPEDQIHKARPPKLLLGSGALIVEIVFPK